MRIKRPLFLVLLGILIILLTGCFLYLKSDFGFLKIKSDLSDIQIVPNYLNIRNFVRKNGIDSKKFITYDGVILEKIRGIDIVVNDSIGIKHTVTLINGDKPVSSVWISKNKNGRLLIEIGIDKNLDEKTITNILLRQVISSVYGNNNSLSLDALNKEIERMFDEYQSGSKSELFSLFLKK